MVEGLCRVAPLIRTVNEDAVLLKYHVFISTPHNSRCFIRMLPGIRPNVRQRAFFSLITVYAHKSSITGVNGREEEEGWGGGYVGGGLFNPWSVCWTLHSATAVNCTSKTHQEVGKLYHIKRFKLSLMN